MFTHIFLFLLGIFLMWIASGFVIDGVEKFSKRTSISKFLTSFLILGILTSLSEISVGFNAFLDNRPEVFVGNLIGGSFVILLFIIPMLAMANRGIRLEGALSQKELLMFLVLISAPAFVILDGRVGVYDAMLLVLLYGLFLYQFQRREQIVEHFKGSTTGWDTVLQDVGRVVVGAFLIYFSAHLLVDSTTVIADALKVSPFLLSLLLLSLGTNLPEIIVALRAISRREVDIAFGDYVGSAAFNAFLFGGFSLMTGTFSLETRGFEAVLFVLLIGYSLVFFFSRSKNTISPIEGFVLMMVFVVYVLLQVNEIIAFSPVV